MMEMELVLAHSQATGLTRLVALILANSYVIDWDCTSTTLESICRWANCSPAEADRALYELIALGEWQQVGACLDGKIMMRLLVRCPVTCDRSVQHLVG
ncbi:hypothetical protein [Devriesea agamarum]|uniref:hypothetical protein n=1 Tax=Devriesea agamarum TaxID=472569 RepID=UPI00071DB322|nr:hypothetical protein [Devriesea agamarum]